MNCGAIKADAAIVRAKSIRRRMAKPVRVRGYNDDLFVRPERPPRLPEEPTAMYEEEDGEVEEGEEVVDT